MYALVVYLMFGAGIFAGALISAGLGALAIVLVRRRTKQRRDAWWIFGGTAGLLFPCALMVVHSRPAAINLPYSVNAKNLWLNSIGYGSSLGLAAAIACVVTLIIARASKNNMQQPLPKQPAPQAHRGSDGRS